MSRDDNLDDTRDDRLSALYRLHMTSDAPSAASDAQVLRMAREAVAPAREVAPVREVLSTKRSPVTRSGWRAWLSAPWFGPGLAFATVASLSVVVIALMPKEELAMEKEVASSPAASSSIASAPAPTSARDGASASGAPATVPGSQRDAPAVAADVANDAAPAQMASRSLSTPSNAAASSSASSSSSRPNASRAKAAPNDARITTGESNVTPRPATPTTSGDRVAPAEPSPAGPAEPIRHGIAPERGPLATTPAFAPFVPSVSQVPAAPAVANSASSLRTEAASAALRERQQPNAFPAQPQLATAPAGGTASAGAAAAPPPPPPPAAAFADGTRPEKQSLQGETTESRMPAPIAEVPDSAPTYPNESRPSIPLPYSYTMPRKSRDANGSAGSARALEKVEKTSAPSLAAATAHRDPAEWVKAILKLKSEGKIEQLTKELADFRKQYPQHVLPEELRQIK